MMMKQSEFLASQIGFEVNLLNGTVKAVIWKSLKPPIFSVP